MWSGVPRENGGLARGLDQPGQELAVDPRVELPPDLLPHRSRVSVKFPEWLGTGRNATEVPNHICLLQCGPG